MRTLRQKSRLPTFRDGQRDRPRVVIENAEPAELFIEQQRLEEAGYEVVTCLGPDDLPNRFCPVAVGGDCPAISQADVIVSSFTTEDAAARNIINGIRERYPDIPLVVVAPPIAASRHPELLDGCRRIYPLTATNLVGAIETELVASS